LARPRATVRYHRYVCDLSSVDSGRTVRVVSRVGNRQPRGRGRLRSALRATFMVSVSERARGRIAEEERLTTQLLATVTFFFAAIQAKVEALGLAPTDLPAIDWTKILK
jgi:hypothetical protein